MYKELYNIIISAGDPPFQELDIVNKYLSEIGLPIINNCNEVLFSVGTMFWYRPIALKKLFHQKITYNDFHEEPIGINGTLAHAIERLPSYIANEAGYDTKMYLNNEMLSKTFYSQYQRKEIKNDQINMTGKEIKIYKKLYFLLIRIIPKNKREIIDYYIRKKLFPKIKHFKIDIILRANKMNISKIKKYKKIELSHWIGFKQESIMWDEQNIYTGDAWAIDYINKKRYHHVYMKVNNNLYRTKDRLSSKDIADYFNIKDYSNTRFYFSFPIFKLNFGGNTFSIIVILNDKKTYYESEIARIYKDEDGGLPPNQG
jgi:hypothetical protein